MWALRNLKDPGAARFFRKLGGVHSSQTIRGNHARMGTESSSGNTRSSFCGTTDCLRPRACTCVQLRIEPFLVRIRPMQGRHPVVKLLYQVVASLKRDVLDTAPSAARVIGSDSQPAIANGIMSDFVL